MEDLLSIVKEFDIPEKPICAHPFGDGHINDTYRITTDTDKSYVLQKLNTSIFKDYTGLTENVIAVTDFIRKKLSSTGSAGKQTTLCFIPLRDCNKYCYANGNDVWRLSDFIENTCSVSAVTRKEDMYSAGLAFGNFVSLLSDFDASTLTEVIPDFHNTMKRFENFVRAYKSAKSSGDAETLRRLEKCANEIRFAYDNEQLADALIKPFSEGKLPLRVTHNDTKINNVLLDADTREPVAVVDLDTVMPGLFLYDFGDFMRAGTNTAAEDEPDTSGVFCSLDFFEEGTKGYLETCGASLTDAEISLLPVSAAVITFETGLRFLTDYLEKDVYFKTAYPDHNFDRAKNQFALVADMLKKQDAMKSIVDKYYRQ